MPETSKTALPESESADDKIGVDEGFQRLLRHFKNPHETREHYNAGLRSNRIRLLAFGVGRQATSTWNVVDPNWIEHHAYVDALQAADGRWEWHAEIVQKGGIGFAGFAIARCGAC